MKRLEVYGRVRRIRQEINSGEIRIFRIKRAFIPVLKEILLGTFAGGIAESREINIYYSIDDLEEAVRRIIEEEIQRRGYVDDEFLDEITRRYKELLEGHRIFAGRIDGSLSKIIGGRFREAMSSVDPDEMIYYIVLPRVYFCCQGDTYESHKKLHLIYAPFHSVGRPVPHWDTVGKVNEGDLIFHICKGEVRAMSIAPTTSKCIDDPTPQYSDQKRCNMGRAVRFLGYFDLERQNKLKVSELKDDNILESNYKNSPFTKDGSCRQAYLTRMSLEVTLAYFEKILEEDCSPVIIDIIDGFCDLLE